jgi:uncharacterized protein
MIFVDTSALLAFLDADSPQHERVVETVSSVLAERRAVTHSYVVIETEALVHRRLGGRVARRLLEDVMPVIDVSWVGPDLHAAAVARHLQALRKRSSLVDQVSFELMRRLEIRAAVALDRDFSRQGFEVVPAPQR